MKWSNKPRNRRGETRTVVRFTFWPTRIGDMTYWLEFVRVVQGWTVCGWENYRIAEADDAISECRIF